MHTYRVMHNVNKLAQEHSIEKSIVDTAFCSAFIHDMARIHDNYCTEHGGWAIDQKLSLFEKDFIKFGLSNEDIESLKTAVTFHSLPGEIDIAHPHYLVTSLLKDADALDRIRLGFDGLNPKYLRLPNSKNLIKIAEQNFFKTVNFMSISYDDFLNTVNS